MELKVAEEGNGNREATSVAEETEKMVVRGEVGMGAEEGEGGREGGGIGGKSGEEAAEEARGEKVGREEAKSGEGEVGTGEADEGEGEGGKKGERGRGGKATEE